MNTYDTFGKLKFKDALAIWTRNNIDKLQITTSKNTHGTKTGLDVNLNKFFLNYKLL